MGGQQSNAALNKTKAAAVKDVEAGHRSRSPVLNKADKKTVSVNEVEMLSPSAGNQKSKTFFKGGGGKQWARRQSIITEGEYEAFRKVKYEDCYKCAYVTAYFLFIVIYPWWLQAALLSPAVQFEYPVSVNGLVISPYPAYCKPCPAPYQLAAQFPVTVSFNVSDPTQTEAEGGGIVLFASTNFADWWIPSYSPPGWVLQSAADKTTLPSGCYDLAGTFQYIVACYVRSGRYQEFVNKGNVRGPPFDDRCSLIGSRCQSSCGGVSIGPHDYCNSSTIPWKYLVSDESGGSTVSVPTDIENWIAWLFVLFCLVNYVNKVLQFSHGIKRDYNRLLSVKNIKGEISRQQYHVWVHIACYREAKQTVLRTYLACIEGMLKLAHELPGLKVTVVLHEDLKKADGKVAAHWYETMWMKLCWELRHALEPTQGLRFLSQRSGAVAPALDSREVSRNHPSMSVRLYENDESVNSISTGNSQPRSTVSNPNNMDKRGSISKGHPNDGGNNHIDVSRVSAAVGSTSLKLRGERVSSRERQGSSAARGSDPLSKILAPSTPRSTNRVDRVSSSPGAHHRHAESTPFTFKSRISSMRPEPLTPVKQPHEQQRKSAPALALPPPAIEPDDQGETEDDEEQKRFELKDNGSSAPATGSAANGAASEPLTPKVLSPRKTPDLKDEDDDDENDIDDGDIVAIKCELCKESKADVQFEDSRSYTRHLCNTCYRTSLSPIDPPKHSNWQEVWQPIQLINALLRNIPEELLQPEAKPDKKKKYWDKDTLSRLVPEPSLRDWFRRVADAQTDHEIYKEYIQDEVVTDFSTRPHVQAAYNDPHVTRRTWQFGPLTLKYRTGPGASRAGKGMGLNMSVGEAAPEFSDSAFAPPEEPLMKGRDGGPTKKQRQHSMKFLNENVFFGIIDARHSPVPDFFLRSVPAFFQRNPHTHVCQRNYPIRFVQSPQYYPVGDFDDWVDRGGGFYFNFLNVLRSFVNCVTSCGTNAFWHLGRLDGGPFCFSEKSLIEDTETSHECVWAGEKSVYINKRTVYGAAKSASDYLAANLRWAQGAVELFSLDSRMHIGISVCVTMFLAAEFAAIVLPWTITNWVAVCMPLILGIFWTVMCYQSDRLHVHIVLWQNTWYWVFGILTALFWVLFLPGWLAFVGGFPFNNVVLLFGLCFTMAMEWILTSVVQKWAGQASEVSLWRNFQVWLISWSMLIMAGYKGFMRQHFPTKLDKMGGWAKSAMFTDRVLPFLVVCQAFFHAGAVGWSIYLMFKEGNVSLFSNSHLAGALSNLIYFIAMPVRVVWGKNPLTVSMRHVSLFTVCFGITSVFAATGGVGILDSIASFWNIF